MKIKLITIALLFLLSFNLCLAQEYIEVQIDYGDSLILDSDLDGLTDVGEQNIFGTDINNPDTDGDGIYDGTEIIHGTDPLNNLFPHATETITEITYQEEKEIPWAWYTVRASGLIAFALLYFSFLFGLAIRMPILSKITKPAYSYSIHRWISVQALILVLIHAFGMLFDNFMKFELKDILIPWVSEFQQELVAFGIIAMYLMILLVVSSYMRDKISHRSWRIIHYLNIILYIFVSIHALYLGTDLQEPNHRALFVLANGALGLLILANIFIRVSNLIKRKLNKPEYDV